MKSQNKIEFLTFNRGTVRIYETDEDDEILSDTGKSFKFGEKKIGINRYYAARQNDIELAKVIYIHRNLNVSTQHAAVINGTRYKIEQVQQEFNSNPPSTVLSLSQRGLLEGAADDY